MGERIKTKKFTTKPKQNSKRKIHLYIYFINFLQIKVSYKFRQKSPVVILMPEQGVKFFDTSVIDIHKNIHSKTVIKVKGLFGAKCLCQAT